MGTWRKPVGEVFLRFENTPPKCYIQLMHRSDEDNRSDMGQHYQQKAMKEVARNLRDRQTPSEQRLWGALRNRQLGGLKFRRQHPIGSSIVDFYCHEAQLVVEVDGSIHDREDVQEHDAARQEFIEAYNVRFVRVSAREVMENLPTVLDRIQQAVSGR